MATSTTTIATTPGTFALCAAESDAAPAVFDFAALYRAWQACRRGKRGTRNAQRYELALLDNLFDTAQALQTHAWRPSRTLRLVTTYPKPREILAARFGDRVVHHALVPRFERLYEPVFIHDSHANRKGHGTHLAVRRLQHFLRASRGGYYLQLDVANFFNSINRRVLFGLLRARLRRDMQRLSRDPRHVPAAEARHMLWLARVLLTGNPAHAAVYQGRPTDLARVPQHKRLGNAPPETGLPIGNLTSQFFANVYLNELDQFVKHELKAHHYLRYVDDFVLVHPDPACLRVWRDAIEVFLRQRLRLALRDAGRLRPVGDGVDFLGYIVRADYLLVRRRVVGHLHDRLTKLRRSALRADGRIELQPAQTDRLQAILASYFGHFHHACNRRLRRQVFLRHPWLAHWLVSDKSGQLRRVDQQPAARSLPAQWRWFKRRYSAHALLQVGNRAECELRPAWARHSRRPGLPLTVSVPMARLGQVQQALTRAGTPWCTVHEHGRLHRRLKCRQLTAIWPAMPVDTDCPAKPYAAAVRQTPGVTKL